MRRLERFRSHIHQETIVYSNDDIEWDGENWVAYGVGLCTGRDYALTFVELRAAPYNYEFAISKATPA